MIFRSVYMDSQQLHCYNAIRQTHHKRKCLTKLLCLPKWSHLSLKSKHCRSYGIKGIEDCCNDEVQLHINIFVITGTITDLGA